MTGEVETEKCFACGGTGRHEGKFVFAGPWPDCGWCGGTGRQEKLVPDEIPPAAAPSPPPDDRFKEEAEKTHIATGRELALRYIPQANSEWPLSEHRRAVLYGQLSEAIASALSSAVAAERAKPGEWLPMESAPLDMTEIIGVDAKGLVAKTWFHAPSSSTRIWLRAPSHRGWTPIGWMPMPSIRARSGGQT